MDTASAPWILDRISVTPLSGPAGEPWLDIREEGSGARYRLLGWHMAPMDYARLRDHQADGPLRVCLEDVRMVDAHGQRLHDESVVARFELDSPFSTDTYALVPGGWLPGPWAIGAGHVVLADRSFVAEVYARFENGQRKRRGPRLDFLDFLMDWRVCVNPLLYAMEGDRRRRPTGPEVIAQWQEAADKLARALPRVRIVPDMGGGLRGAFGLLGEGTDGFQRKSAFLQAVAPELMARPGKARRAAVLERVLAQAERHGVARLSLPVLAVWAALTAARGPNPAQGLLKPSAHYGPDEAYNALCDLRALELLLRVQALFPGHSAALWTRDRNLALFWAGLDIVENSSGQDGRPPQFRISLASPLLAGATDEERAVLG